MWEGVETSFHIPTLHEFQKCKISGRQEKGHQDDWCNIGNQKTNNPNSQSPQKHKNQAPIMPATRKTMTQQQAIRFVMAAKMSKERMSKHHHLEFWLLNLKQTVQQLQAKKNKRIRFSAIRS